MSLVKIPIVVLLRDRTQKQQNHTLVPDPGEFTSTINGREDLWQRR
jgi:hypothetical protein